MLISRLPIILHAATFQLDASTRCRIKCPTQFCPDGLKCFTGTGCPALPYDSPAPIEPSPTHAPSLLQEANPSPSSAPTELNGKVISSNPTDSNAQLNSDLPSNIPTASNTQADVTNSPIPRETESTTIALGDNHLDDNFVERSGSPTIAASLRPTVSQSNVIITSTPTEHTQSLDINFISLPDVTLKIMPKPSPTNIETIQKILQNTKPILDSEIFVVETRGGSVIPSNVYTFDGFVSSLEYLTETGIDEDYFYLGDVDDIHTDEKTIHEGLVNLALFIAKVVTDAVVYESCDPNKLACGISALDSTFDGNTQFQCSNRSQHFGLECQQKGIGCACILGILDYHVGSKSQSRSTPYSEVHFCSTDAFESICSRYLRNGEELRWLTPMTYWVSFVQRYQSNDLEFAETYVSGLVDFVRNGMRDTSFVEFVSDISIHVVERAPKSKFVATYFKVIDLFLSELTLMIPEQLTRTPSDSPITSLVPQVIVSESVLPITAPTTSMPVTIDNQSLSKTCPKLCVIPIKSSECPLPHQRLKYCFSNFIGIDEVCMAAYGECETSKVSINDCGQTYNVFKRIDCSVLVDYPPSEREESSSSLAPSLLNSQSSQPVSSEFHDQTSENPSTLPSNTPTAKPTSFGGIVWWDSINTSSGRSNCPGVFYNTLAFISYISFMLRFN